MLESFPKWLPLLVALIAAAVTLRQVRANNITNSRLKWLEQLKATTTEFIAECLTVTITIDIVKQAIAEGADKEQKVLNQMDYVGKLNENVLGHLKIIEAKYYLIKLNLNPNEDLHQKLEVLLEEQMKFINQAPLQKTKHEASMLHKKMDALTEKMVLLIRYIMKLEWEKTKRSYLSNLYYANVGKGKDIRRTAINIYDSERIGDKQSEITRQ